MTCTRFKEDDPFDDVIKSWEEQEAKELAKILWPEKSWTKNVEYLELFGEGEFMINGDPFAKSTPVHRKS